MLTRLFCRYLLTLILVLLGMPAHAENSDAVAVVIGNQNYRNIGVPKVNYAQRDADAFDRYLIDVLGYRDGNIINLRDATQAEMEAALGNARTSRGRLWRIIKQGKSEVTVFFSGHGAPGQEDRKGYLMPTDADPQTPEINGFPINLLLDNLSKLGAKSIVVYIDACFSGETQGGSLVGSASPINIVAIDPVVPRGMVVMTAAQGDQIASWDDVAHHGLFTEYLLRGLYGEADHSPYGNGDGEITAKKLKSYLDDKMTYQARREFGRVQSASLLGEAGQVLSTRPKGSLMGWTDIPDVQTSVMSTPRVSNSAPVGDILDKTKQKKESEQTIYPQEAMLQAQIQLNTRPIQPSKPTEMGPPDAIKVSGIHWVINDKEYSHFDFIMLNMTPEVIHRVEYIVFFYDGDGNLLHTEDGHYPGSWDHGAVLYAGLPKTISSGTIVNAGGVNYPGDEIRDRTRSIDVKIVKYN